MLRFTRVQPGTAGVRSAVMRRWKVKVERGVFAVLVMMASGAGVRHTALAQSDQGGPDTKGGSEKMSRLEREAAKGSPANLRTVRRRLPPCS